MSSDELEIIDENNLSIVKLISIISKNHTSYLNHKLEHLNINVSQLHFLFEIYHQKNINQEKLASRCIINKGAVARSIQKLEENGFVIKEVDNNNRRQNKVSLTQKGDETLKKAMKYLDEWERDVLRDNHLEKIDLQKSLKDMAIKSIEYNRRE